MPSAATLLPAETERWFDSNNSCDAMRLIVNTRFIHLYSFFLIFYCLLFCQGNKKQKLTQKKKKKKE